jgi:signal transduction histidine kinase
MLYLHRKRKVNLELCHKNEELSEARDQAEAANKAKSIFLQNMSHEIRTPLNSIVGFSQLITSPDANLSQEERQDFCHLIQHNSDLLLTLVGDILSAAELESNRYTMKIAPHSCNKLCREAITTVEHRKPEGVKLYYTSEVDDCYELSTDGQRVCQILINFLTNAEKHTTQGEIRLHCSLTENPGYVTFSVTDTGTGIPPEYSETIFERFEKADSFGQGTGLGLNICRLIAERLKGKVLLDKEYKEGARFVFVLPVKKSI